MKGVGFGRACSLRGDDDHFLGDKHRAIDMHHTPAAISHLYALQKLVDSEDDARIILESDGYEFSMVDWRDYDDLRHATPGDFDMMILVNHFQRGSFAGAFRGSRSGKNYEIHRYNLGGTAGIGYMITRTGAKKLLTYAATHNYELIDAWILGTACSGKDTVLDRDQALAGKISYTERSPGTPLVCYNVFEKGKGILPVK